MRFADDPEVLAFLRRERKWEVDFRRAKLNGRRAALRAMGLTLLGGAVIWAAILWAVYR
jgi:hypothetical protein